jgi:alpha-ketoglutarate-dependent taurine dioxygenase
MRTTLARVEIRPLTPHLGLELVDLDIRTVTSENAVEIASLLLRHGILLIRDQRANTKDHVRFSRLFGRLEQFPTKDDDATEEVVFRISNDGTRGYKGVGLYWHTDGYFHAHPTAVSILHAVAVPPTGGDTHFANMARAYSVLPADTREWLENLIGVSRPAPGAQRSAGLFGRSSVTGTRHPLIRPHPLTGIPVLYINVGNMAAIEGLERKQTKDLITSLAEHVEQGDFTYCHRWQAGDMVLWDNAGVAHKATAPPTDSLRLMERTTIIGDEYFSGDPFWRAAADAAVPAS